ncbi:MAG TPA: VanZ family protein [Holophagaceae bacterium]|nr:VanZ family protein [Holophagaceae bacterium]
MRRPWLWILPFAVACAIVWLSHQTRYPFGLHLPPPLDKLAHASVYGLLALLLDLAWGANDRRRPLYRRHLMVFLLVSLYGVTDELHQHFVPGRSCDGLDWVADTVGGGLGLAVLTLSRLRSRRWLSHSWMRGEARRPDPARELILVADPHWSSELRGLEEATTAHPEADWLFLGDVFDVWVGLPGMETDAQRRFLAWVSARRAAGRWVGLWMGNREYFLDGHAAAFDLMGEGLGGGLPGEGLAWEHGDLVNTGDWRYRLWNLVSRSGPLWIFFRLLPARSAAALAARLEARLHTTNREYKLAFPREAFARAAAEQPDRTFLTGHFHTRETEGNGLALPWAFEGRFMVWRGAQIQEL